jgi:hypothetical protein
MLCRQHPASLQSPRLSGHPGEASHVQTATATGPQHLPIQCLSTYQVNTSTYCVHTSMYCYKQSTYIFVPDHQRRAGAYPHLQICSPSPQDGQYRHDAAASGAPSATCLSVHTKYILVYACLYKVHTRTSTVHAETYWYVPFTY